MQRFGRTPRLEGPLAAVAGGLVGGLIGGGGTLAGLATTGGLIGSAIGSVVVGSLLQPKTPSYPTAAAPVVPATPAVPEIPGTPAASAAAATPAISPETATPTAEEIAKGELERKRRGRLSTILTARNPANTPAGGSENETLG